MCTVSVVPFGGGFRLVCNRDERYLRPEALPPTTRRLGPSVVATFPVDPQSDGTWVGVNDAGLAAALLNRNTDDGAHVPARLSRGLVVPSLLRSRTLDEACEAAALINWRAFDPFRVVLVQGGIAAVIIREESGIAMRRLALTEPLMLTSSSLGDARVEPPRRSLFERLVLAAEDRVYGQLLFHRHRWPTQPEISVRMQRNDAATVSRTRIDVHGDAIEIDYERTCSHTL